MKKPKDTIRNERFIIAFDYLNRYQGIANQKQLAALMGMSEDSITRVKNGGKVTENFIANFQTAAQCVFNLQWLRGESEIMLATESERISAAINPHQSATMPMPDYSSLMNATIAAQEATISSLKRELADKEASSEKVEASMKREVAAKDETIRALRSELATKNAYIESLKQQLVELRSTIAKQQSKDALGGYPFPIGVAEGMSQQQPSK